MCFSLYLRAFRQNLTAVELRGFWHFEQLVLSEPKFLKFTTMSNQKFSGSIF